MEIVSWTGKAVPDNRRLIVGHGRLVPNKAYQEFKTGLAWEIKAGCKKKFKRVNLMISVELANKQMDKQNLLKPICDAVEFAGIIKNDRDIEVLMIMPAVLSKDDKQDHIYMWINGVER